MVCVKLVRWSVHLEVLLLCNLHLSGHWWNMLYSDPRQTGVKIFNDFLAQSLQCLYAVLTLKKKNSRPKTNPTHDPEKFWDWKIVFMFTVFLCGHFCLVLCSLLSKVTVVLWATENSYSQGDKLIWEGLPVTVRTKCQVFLDVAILALSVPALKSYDLTGWLLCT